LFAIEEKFTKGQVISFRSNVTSTLLNDTKYHYLNINKTGKPNVTGVDVTPFVNVPQPLIQSAYLVSTTSFGVATITGALTSNTNNGIFSYNATTGVYTVLKNAKFDISASLSTAGANTVIAVINPGSFIGPASNSVSVLNNWTTTSWTGQLNVGETITITNGSNTTDRQRISVVATALSDQILTAPETFSTDTAALTYAGSGTYTLSTLANAPVGTFITYTYATSTNTRTQTTTAPTQTTADMNTNGIFITARPYNTASTSATPSTFAIQIGKGLKGRTVDIYKSTAKTTGGDISYWVQSTGTDFGALTVYDEKTGILVIDAGGPKLSTNTSSNFAWNDLSSSTTGYLVINASKNPALTGFNLPRVNASYYSTSGQAFNNGPTTALFATKLADSHGAYNTGTGVYTIPETGTYTISCMMNVGGGAAASATQIKTYVRVDSTTNYLLGAVTANGSTGPYFPGGTLSMYLAKGQTIDIRIQTTTAGTQTQSTSLGENTFTIVKAGN
jgi:hypothetical protein